MTKHRPLKWDKNGDRLSATGTAGKFEIFPAGAKFRIQADLSLEEHDEEQKEDLQRLIDEPFLDPCHAVLACDVINRLMCARCSSPSTSRRPAASNDAPPRRKPRQKKSTDEQDVSAPAGKGKGRGKGKGKAKGKGGGKGGRPPGSKNKGGRPKGSKNKPKEAPVTTTTSEAPTPAPEPAAAPKRRGRKPKEAATEAATEAKTSNGKNGKNGNGKNGKNGNGLQADREEARAGMKDAMNELLG